jgi:hypothetical protein
VFWHVSLRRRFHMRPNETTALKTILIAVAADSLVISFAAMLVVNGVLSTALLAALGFFLFWANYMFVQARSRPVGTSWKSLSLEGTAGIYFSGALWGLVSLARDREWNQIFGPVIALAIGTFCLSRSRRLRTREERDSNE